MASGSAVVAPTTQQDGYVGFVHGQVQEDLRTVTFWGGRALLGAGLALAVVLVIRGGAEAIAGLVQLGFLLLGAAVLLALAPALLGRGGSAAAGIGRFGSDLARGAGTVVRVGVAGTRGAAGLLARSGASAFPVVVHRFRIQDLTGAVTSCVLTGEVDGDLMRQGDLVRVVGARGRNGVVVARSVAVLHKPELPPRTVIHARHPIGFRVARALDIVAKVGAALLLLYTFGVATGAS